MTEKIRFIVTGRVLSVLCSLFCALLCLILVVPFLNAPKIHSLRWSAGPESTRRYVVAEYIAEHATRNGLSIQYIPNAGTEESLHLVRTGELDAAIVSSSVNIPQDDDNIRLLAALDTEVVHVLIRESLANKGPLAVALRGARVNLGQKGSTEWLLANEYLDFLKLKLPTSSKSGDVITTEYSKQAINDRCQAILKADETEKALLIKELPDCFLLLATMPSPVAQRLIEAADYRIVPLPATTAFLLEDMQDRDSPTTIIEREFLERKEIPSDSYYFGRGFPEANCETVGVRLLLVANKSVTASAINPLMKAIFEGEPAHRLLPESPRELATQYAIHPAAVAYLDRHNPILVVNDLVEWISKGLSFLGAFSAGALSLYTLLRHRRTRAPSDYLSEIRKIGQVALTIDTNAGDSTPGRELTRQLDERLLRLRQELIDDVCESKIKGEQIVFNILTLLNETRRDLPSFRNDETSPLHRFAPPTISGRDAA